MTKGGKREGAGRPSLSPTDKKQLHTIKMDAEMWAHCCKQPGKASAYIRRLIEQDRQRNEPDAPTPHSPQSSA